MSDIERQSKIVELLQSGMGISDIANQLGISTNRVSKIIRQDKETKEQESRCAEFLDEIRACSNIDRKWNVEYWLDCLFMSKRARRSLGDYYRQKKISEICIMEFMDLIIDARSTDFKSRYTSHPILRLKSIGHMTFQEILEKLTWINLGDTLNQEWNARLIVYKRHDLIFQRLFGSLFGACGVEFQKSYKDS